MTAEGVTPKDCAPPTRIFLAFTEREPEHRPARAGSRRRIPEGNFPRTPSRAMIVGATVAGPQYSRRHARLPLALHRVGPPLLREGGFPLCRPGRAWFGRGPGLRQGRGSPP